MKLPAIMQVKTADEARNIAVDWQTGLQDEDMSWGDVIAYAAYFEELAFKFDLTEEFQENGLI